LSDVIKTLIVTASFCATRKDKHVRETGRKAFASVLRLSQEPQVPLAGLDSISWGHSFGINEVARGTLFIYLLLNLVDPIHVRKGERDLNLLCILDMASFRLWSQESVADYEYPSQNLLHWHFWGAYGIDADSFVRTVFQPLAEQVQLPRAEDTFCYFKNDSPSEQ
jgi:hypothetical protein